MTLGPVALPGAKQSLGIALIVLIVLYAVARVDSAKKFIYG